MIGERGETRIRLGTLERRGARLLCIRVRIWWSASESHRSGYLLARQIRVPSPHPTKLKVAYGNHSFDSHSLAAFIDNFTVGTAGWTRTTFSPLKRRDSGPLSYDGMAGTRCRLSACDIRFVGPTLFTSELTGHEWRPLAVTIRSHQVDSLAATPVASVVRLAADLRLERSASGLTVRFPHPGGLSAK